MAPSPYDLSCWWDVKHKHNKISNFRPPVRSLSSIGRFNEAKSIHSGGVFYMFIGEDDSNGDLFVCNIFDLTSPLLQTICTHIRQGSSLIGVHTVCFKYCLLPNILKCFSIYAAGVISIKQTTFSAPGPVAQSVASPTVASPTADPGL